LLFKKEKRKEKKSRDINKEIKSKEKKESGYFPFHEPI
jgi:hypothetical protein